MKHLTLQSLKHFLSLSGLVFLGMIMFFGNVSANSNVFYSISPYGTGDIKVASNITITNGVATLTQAQTGNIGAGVAIEYNSLKAYIAPNRIPFTSGGTTELEPGTKITGATSGATGIIRAMETTSGTWAGGDAVGWIYFEKTTGTFNSSEQINRTKPTTITNIVTTNGIIQGNIGNGNTEFVVKTAIGGTPSNQTEIAVISIHHVWDSLANFETNFVLGDYVNNTDLTLAGADVIVYAACYYDHANQIADITAVTINFGTTGEDNYLQIYTPVGGAESLDRQRHSGVWSDEKYRLITNNANGIYFAGTGEEFLRFDGLQIQITGTFDRSGIYNGNWTVDDTRISNCILDCTNTGTSYGIRTRDSDNNVKIWNTVILGFASGVYGMGNREIYNSTISDSTNGIESTNGTVTVTNSAVFNNTDDFNGTITVTYSASDDTQAGTGNIDWANEAIDWANIFTDHANGNFHLNNYTTAGIAIINQGVPLFSENIWRDINGNERPATWDIGADEADFTAPIITEITPIPTPSTDTTPTYTFNTNEAGTISYGGSCSSITTLATLGNNTITFNALTSGTYSDCTITVTDAAANLSNILAITIFTIDTISPILTEVTSISPTTDTTPAYTFNTTEAGTISYGGSCSSSTTSAISGDNTITLNELTPGTYSNCTITVTDTLSNISNVLTITSFTINSTGGGFISPSPPVIPISPNQTFEVIEINNQLTINLNNIENVHQIAISTTPDFEYVSWEPYREKIILPSTEIVYLKFRSQTGGVSEVYEVETRHCLVPTDNLPNGSLVRMINTFKIYIINNNHIRHILDRDIFNFYGHLNWESIQEVDSLNNYQESYLIRGVNDYKVYEIRDNQKHWLNMTEEEFEEKYSWGEIYIINEEELGWYK